MRKLLSLILTLAMAFSVCVLPAQAAVSPEEPVVRPHAVVTRWEISADLCQEMYDEMGDYNGWSGDLASVLAEIAGGGSFVGGAVALASLFQQINFNTAKRALKNGAESGRGCTMIIYDNAAPTILAN